METPHPDILGETVEILLDEALMAGIKRGLEDLECGDTISWDEAQEALGW